MARTFHDGIRIPQGAAAGRVWVSDASGGGSWQQVGSAGITDGAVTNVKLASGIDGAKLTNATVTAAKMATPDIGTFSFATNWQGYSGWGVRVSKHAGIVTIEGLAQRVSTAYGYNAASSVIGTIPAGFRPGSSLMMTNGYEDSAGARGVNRLDVGTNGEVRIVLQFAGGGNNGLGGWQAVLGTWRAVN